MQAHNADIVLQFIKRHGPLSRAETARSLGFSKSAISSLIGLLLDEQLLQTVGTGHPATGRRSQLVSFNPNAFFTVAIHLFRGRVRCALINLEGRIIIERVESLRDRSDAAEVIEHSAGLIEQVVRHSGTERARVTAVGVMIPGIVDSVTGRVLYSSQLGWDDPVDLAGELQKHVKLPIFLDNDANALALAEVWVGHGARYTDIALIFLSDGVGGAYFSGSHLLRGRSSAGMEIGKMNVCGKEGIASVESYLSFKSLCSLFGLDDDPKVTDTETLFHQVQARTRADRSAMRRALSETTDMLAQLTANLVAVVNPEAVFLETPLTEVVPGFMEELETRVAAYLPRKPKLSVQMFPASLDAERAIVGGAAIAMYRTRFRFIITGGPGSDGASES